MFEIPLDELDFKIDESYLANSVTKLQKQVKENGFEKEIIHYLNIAELERLTNCCQNLEMRENTTQIPYRVLFKRLHELNPFPQNRRIQDIFNIYTDSHSEAPERRENLKEALLFKNGASNEYIYRILTVENYIKNNNVFSDQLQDYLDFLKKVLQIFSRHSRQNGRRSEDGYRTFQEISCCTLQIEDYINFDIMYKTSIETLLKFCQN